MGISFQALVLALFAYSFVQMSMYHGQLQTLLHEQYLEQSMLTLKVVLAENQTVIRTCQEMIAAIELKLNPENLTAEDQAVMGEIHQVAKQLKLLKDQVEPYPKDFRVNYQLYDTLEDLWDREEFHRKRIAASSTSAYPFAKFAQFNLHSAMTDFGLLRSMYAEGYEWSNRKFGYEGLPEKTHFCPLVTTFKNNNHYRIEMNLNSLIQQNYSNYLIIVIDDNSQDGTYERVLRYIDIHGLARRNIVLIKNEKNEGAMANFYTASHVYCDEEGVVMTADGDDEFLNPYVMQIFNSHYLLLKPGFMNSNFLVYNEPSNFIYYGYSSGYPDHIKANNQYRSDMFRGSHLRTYWNKFFRLIPISELQENGQWYGAASDVAMEFPIMEFSCQRVYFFNLPLYLYKSGTGLNDDALRRGEQLRIERLVRSLPQHQCQIEAYTQRNAPWPRCSEAIQDNCVKENN